MIKSTKKIMLRLFFFVIPITLCIWWDLTIRVTILRFMLFQYPNDLWWNFEFDNHVSDPSLVSSSPLAKPGGLRWRGLLPLLGSVGVCGVWCRFHALLSHIFGHDVSLVF